MSLMLIAQPLAAQQAFNNPNGTIVTPNTTQSQSLSGTPTNTLLAVRNADASTTRLLLDSAGAAVSNSFTGRHARGTIAAPTATQSGDNINLIQGFSYGASAYSTASTATIALTANQNQTNTAWGSKISLFTTPNGSATLSAAAMTVENDSGITVPPTVSGGSKGAGTLNATQLYRAGTVLATVATSASASDLSAGTLAGARGGTGFSSYTVGDLLYADSGTTLAKLVDVATGSLLASGGVAAGPGYCVACTLTTSLTTPKVLGGTGTTSTLSLQSTSGAGGSTDEIKFLVGSNGGTNAGNIYGTGRWNVGATDVAPDSLMTVMANTAATVAPLSGTHVHIVGADAAATRLTLDNFGSANVLNARHASGTLASKTGTASGSTMFAFGVAGWDGTSAYYSTASLNFVSTETFSTTLGGSQIQFFSTPNGTHSSAQAMTLQQSGGLSVGTTTDLGIGTVLANGAIKSLSTTVASSKTTGSIIAGGGIGVAGATYTDTLNIITVANASTTAALCWNSGTGLVTENGAVGTCTVSTLAAKNLVAPLTPKEGFDIVMAMDPWRYELKEGLPTYRPGENIGFIAEYALKKEPRLVAKSGEKIDGFLYEQYTAALTAAVQHLASRINQLETGLK